MGDRRGRIRNFLVENAIWPSPGPETTGAKVGLGVGMLGALAIISSLPETLDSDSFFKLAVLATTLGGCAFTGGVIGNGAAADKEYRKKHPKTKT